MVSYLEKMRTYKRKTKQGKAVQDVMVRAAKLVINNHQNKEFWREKLPKSLTSIIQHYQGI